MSSRAVPLIVIGSAHTALAESAAAQLRREGNVVYVTHSAEGCLRVASVLGASCVRAIGTTPGVFTKPECETFLREHCLKMQSI